MRSAGKWLAALNDIELNGIDAERRAFAELSWDDRYGDRHTAMVILVCGASSADILDALHGALLTDEEVRRPRDWIRYDDPFGDWHEEPCMDRTEVADNAVRCTQQDGDPS